MKDDLLLKVLDSVGFACWAEIITDYPRCTYYFGPFISKQEAETAKDGYIEDLEREGAQGISVIIKRCKPYDLTICEENELNSSGFRTIMSLRNRLS